MAQQHAARGIAIGEMKADGIDYDERMALLEEITWPQPLAGFLEPLYDTYRQSHPWLPEDALGPKSVVRHMWEDGMGFTDFVSRYQLSRSEGLVLRYLSDAYRTLRHTVPERYVSEELGDLVEWLGETIRQTDSSLIDEWEALADPGHASHAVSHHEPPPPPRPLSRQERVFTVMIRNAMWARVQAVARDDLDALVRLDAGAGDAGDAGEWSRSDWDAALDAYYDSHDEVLLDADARSPALLQVGEVSPERRMAVTQTLHDPAGDHDWVIEAEVDVAESDERGELVLRTVGMRCL